MTIALIPARGGSKSIARKNIKEINGRPLLYWTLDAACGCPGIDAVYVMTDSAAIRRAAERYGHGVQVAGRSAASAADTAPTERAMLEFTARHAFDTLVLVQATSPLLRAAHLRAGLDRLRQCDSVLSVVRQKRFIWQETPEGARAVNYDIRHRPRRQEFEGYFVENGAFYITSREGLLRTGCRLNGKIGLAVLPEDSYAELDEPCDWAVVEMLLRRNEQGQTFSGGGRI